MARTDRPARHIAFALVLLPMFAGIATARDDPSHVWAGRNGWEVALAPISNRGLQCLMTRETPQRDHQLGWIWENTHGLYLMFMDGNMEAANDQNWRDEPSGREKFIVSVDGRVIEDRGYIRTVLTLPSSGRTVSFMPSILIAFDHNGPDNQPRPDTADIFDTLRTGNTLKIETYGAIYADDLRGIGAALDQFPACFERQRQVMDGDPAQ